MNIPSSLYKYTTFDSATRIIQNQSFRWSSILDFNDPFESRFHLDEKNESNAIRLMAIASSITCRLLTPNDTNTIYEQFKEKRPGKHQELVKANNIINTSIQLFIENKTVDNYLNIEKAIRHSMSISDIMEKTIYGYKGFIDATHKIIKEKFGVLCLSKIPNNHLMWSHYAQNHTGIMFEIDIEKLKECTVIANTLKKIKYTEQFPEITFEMIKGMNKELFPEEAKKLFEVLLLTKQEIWNYENEYRSIIPIKNLAENGLFSLPKECFKSVTLGCAMQEQDRNKILCMIHNHLPETS
ncbi:DUF2971 domain-containing protein, partial [Salmonella enterica]|nr:DUF2971 domain-containing protein [Salmonella enterica]